MGTRRLTLLLTLAVCPPSALAQPADSLAGRWRLYRDGDPESEHVLTSDGRFESRTWVHREPYETAGTWRRVGPEGLVRLDSDRQPVEAVAATAEAGAPGYRMEITVPAGEGAAFMDLVRVEVECVEPAAEGADEPRRLWLQPDAAGRVAWTDCRPRHFRVSSARTDVFPVERFFGPLRPEEEGEPLGPFRRRGDPAENVWRVALERPFFYYDGALFYLYEGRLYALGEAMGRAE